MQKLNKIIVVFFIITCLMSLICINQSKALDPNDFEPNPITKYDIMSVKDKVGVILGALRNVSVIVAVLATMGIGLKYILGSVEEKAEYKKSMTPLVVGMILAASGTTIVSFIYNAVTQ